MFGNKNQQMPAGQQKGQSPVEEALGKLAVVLALISGFLICPVIYEHSYDPVYDYLYDSYDSELVSQLGIYVWTALATSAFYYIAKATFILSLLVIAQRLIIYAI